MNEVNKDIFPAAICIFHRFGSKHFVIFYNQVGNSRNQTAAEKHQVLRNGIVYCKQTDSPPLLRYMNDSKTF